MKMSAKLVTGAFGVFVLSLAMISHATAGCNMELEIENGFNVPINIEEIKTSSSTPPVYKSQWNGSTNIKAGATKTFFFTTGADCVDGSGVIKFWDMRIFRENGKRHSCFHVDDTALVTLIKPDNCSIVN